MQVDLTRTDRGLELEYPVELIDLSECPVGECQARGERQQFRVPLAEERQLRGYLARTHGYPDNSQVVVEDFRNHPEPVVSCVILVMFNDLFVHNVLIPSILACSGETPLEILIVYNGRFADMGLFSQFPVLTSEFGSTVRGYNAGIAAARAPVVALFHDDCLLTDPNWLAVCLRELEDASVAAVTPEVDTEAALPALKAVPLVFRKDRFPGYDPHYYVGVEDVDIALSILAEGQRFVRVPIGYMHVRGLSSSLVVCEKPETLRELFGLLFFSRPEVAKIHRYSMEKLVAHKEIQLIEADFRLYCLEKYAAYLDGEKFNRQGWENFFHARLHPYLFEPEARLALDRDRLRAFYEGLNCFEAAACP